MLACDLVLSTKTGPLLGGRERWIDRPPSPLPPLPQFQGVSNPDPVPEGHRRLNPGGIGASEKASRAQSRG